MPEVTGTRWGQYTWGEQLPWAAEHLKDPTDGNGTFVIAEGSELPILQQTLRDTDADTPALSFDDAIEFKAQHKHDSKTISGTAQVDELDPAVVSYRWSGTDADTPGFYYYRWKVTYQSGVEQFFPASGFYTLAIRPDL